MGRRGGGRYSNIDGALSADVCKIANVFADETLRRFFSPHRMPSPSRRRFRTRQKLLQPGHFAYFPSPESFSLSLSLFSSLLFPSQTSSLRGYAIRPHEFQNNTSARCLQNTHERLRGRAKPARRRIFVPVYECVMYIQAQVLSRKPNTRRGDARGKFTDCVPRSKLSFDERNFAKMKKNSVAG